MSLTAEQIVTMLTEPVSDGIVRMDELGQRGSTAELVRALSLTTDPLTRRLICDLLGRQRQRGSLTALLDAVRDESPGVRAAAADAIGKVFGYVEDPPLDERPRALKVLVQQWGVDESDAVRSTLAQTMALLGDRSVAPLLRDALHDPDRRVRGQAEWGLRHLGELRDPDLSKGSAPERT